MTNTDFDNHLILAQTAEEEQRIQAEFIRAYYGGRPRHETINEIMTRKHIAASQRREKWITGFFIALFTAILTIYWALTYFHNTGLI